MICNIVGGGDSKSLAQPDAFTIGTNFHCEWANIIFAVDEPVVKDLLRLKNQLVFTNPKVYIRFRHDSKCFSFDSKQFYRTSSLSSGLSAICLANLLGFTKINLYGFDKIISNYREDKTKFEMIKDKNREYIFI